MSAKKLFSIFLLLTSFNLFAQIKHAPPNFVYNGKKVVFVDFKEATYDLSFDSTTKTVVSTAVIQFESDEAGMPVFDLVLNPISLTLDGKPVNDHLINSPDGETQFRIAEMSIAPGKHSFKIVSQIIREVEFSPESVSAGFWFSDYKDRAFLEAYLPTNLEYDQYKMTFNVDFKNLKNQKIYSNGKVSRLTDSSFKIEFSPDYTSSSVFFSYRHGGEK
jgi:hypothetical protein